MNIKRWLTGIGVIVFLSVSMYVIADQADTLDLHSNVKEAVGIADVSSAVCVEVDASGNLQTDVNDMTPGVAATSLGKAEDAAHASGNVGVQILSVRQDTAAALGGTDADYQPLITDASGRLHVIEPSAAAIAVDLAALEVLLTASNVDLDAIETLITAGNVDLAAIEVLITDGNVDLAAIEVLNTAIQVAVETVPAKTGVVNAAAAVIKAAPGTVYAVLVSGAGVTAADKIEIYNSPTSAIGDALFTVVADAANGTWAFYPCVGVSFDSGIYYDETKSGGTFTTTVVYE